MSKEDFRRAFSLRDQHFQPVDRNQPPRPRIEEQPRFQRVIDDIHHRLARRKLRELDRRHQVLRIHPDGCRVDDQPCVRVAVKVAVMVFARTGHDHDLPCAQIAEHAVRRHRRAAAAEHQYLASRDGNAVFLEQIPKAVVIRVVAPHGIAVEPNGVDAADATGHVTQLVAKGDDVLFVRNRHIDRAVRRRRKKRR